MLWLIAKIRSATALRHDIISLQYHDQSIKTVHTEL